MTSGPPDIASLAAGRNREPLDDVVWAALSGPHSALALGDERIKRYPPEVAPFGAMRPSDAGSRAHLASLLSHGGSVAVLGAVGARPFEGAEAAMRATLDQMVLEDRVALARVEPVDAARLGDDDVPDMMALVEATRPGPFGPRTIALGRYLGIRIEGRLVAMGGERLRVPGFTEVSAICVAPECRGRGYAAGLVRTVADAIVARGDTPFLHVLTENAGAIALYRRLGFVTRRQFGLNVFSGVT